MFIIHLVVDGENGIEGIFTLAYKAVQLYMLSVFCCSVWGNYQNEKSAAEVCILSARASLNCYHSTRTRRNATDI